jgi:hypothetical protein
VKGRLEDIAEKAAETIRNRFQSQLSSSKYRADASDPAKSSLTNGQKLDMGQSRSAMARFVMPTHTSSLQGQSHESVESMNYLDTASFDVPSNTVAISQRPTSFAMAMHNMSATMTIDDGQMQQNVTSLGELFSLTTKYLD